MEKLVITKESNKQNYSRTVRIPQDSYESVMKVVVETNMTTPDVLGKMVRFALDHLEIVESEY